MDDAPRRWKTIEEFSPAEHALRQQAQRRGEPEPRFETDEYAEHHRAFLARHRLDPEGESVFDRDDPRYHAERRSGSDERN